MPPPGQNLNNARSVNFGSVYSSGQLVPVPTCPTGMTPQIFAVPISVSGVNDVTVGSSPTVYPISSFTAYATAPSDGISCPDVCRPASAGSGGAKDNCASATVGGINKKYWRVCLAVTTEKGQVSITESDQADTKFLGSILAVTRCAPGSPTITEPVGSVFQVYQP